MAARSRGRLCPSLAAVDRPMGAKGRREGRAPAAPVGPCAIGVHTGWTDRVADRPAFPARMVLTVSFVLSPGSDALLPPSPCGWLMHVPGRAAASPQALTHRPRASGPHDFSVRGRSRRNRRGLACAHPRRPTSPLSSAVSSASRGCLTVARPVIPHLAPTLPRPPPPGPHIVTVANAPLAGPGWRVYDTNPKFGKAKCFCAEGLTRCSLFCPTGRVRSPPTPLVIPGRRTARTRNSLRSRF
jgi:hypothetical protein